MHRLPNVTIWGLYQDLFSRAQRTWFAQGRCYCKTAIDPLCPHSDRAQLTLHSTFTEVIKHLIIQETNISVHWSSLIFMSTRRLWQNWTSRLLSRKLLRVSAFPAPREALWRWKAEDGTKSVTTTQERKRVKSKCSSFFRMTTCQLFLALKQYIFFFQFPQSIAFKIQVQHQI